jgi:hypothetical protein
MPEHEFFKSVSQILRQRKVVTVLAVEYICCTRLQHLLKMVFVYNVDEDFIN